MERCHRACRIMDINIDQREWRDSLHIRYLHKEKVCLYPPLAVQPKSGSDIPRGHAFQFLRHHAIQEVNTIRTAHRNGSPVRHIHDCCTAPKGCVLKFKKTVPRHNIWRLNR